MAGGEPKDNAVTTRIRAHALRYPGTSEKGVCVNRAIQAGTKSFVFMGVKPTGHYDFRLKLADSYSEAESLAEEHPDRYVPGKHGWTHVKYGPKDKPPRGLLERWVDESYRLIAPKKLVAELPSRGYPK